MDHHIWFDLRVLYDIVHGTQHVSDCRKIKTPDAKAVWWQMDILPGYSSGNLPVYPVDVYYYVQTKTQSKRQKKKAFK